jgi:DNA-binding helix-hairpin-helix protein with protein kinase domain
VVSFVLFMTGIPAAAAAAMMLALLWLILRSVSPYAKARKTLLGDLKNATAEVARAESEWRSKIDAQAKAFGEKKQALSKLRAEYQSLPEVFKKEEDDLQSKRRENQVKAFLRGHFIEDATIKGIGAGRISVLRSFGIETALDVTPDKVSAVDGFGPARTSAVVGWRQSVEARFRFDPNKAVDPAERAALVQRQSQRRAGVETALTKGLTELQQMRSTADQAWQTHQHRYSTAALHRQRAATAASTLTLPAWAA